MKTEQHEDYTLTYDDSTEAKERIYEIALKWFKQVKAFNGESIFQRDTPQIKAPELAAKMAEKGFKFKRKWKE